MTEPADIEVFVSFAGASHVAADDYGDSPEVEQHARKPLPTIQDAIAIPAAEFFTTWQKAIEAVEAVFTADQQRKKDHGLRLDSITAKLSVSASGKVAFVGELGGEVAFEAVFKRA